MSQTHNRVLIIVSRAGRIENQEGAGIIADADNGQPPNLVAGYDSGFAAWLMSGSGLKQVLPVNLD